MSHLAQSDVASDVFHFYNHLGNYNTSINIKFSCVCLNCFYGNNELSEASDMHDPGSD